MRDGYGVEVWKAIKKEREGIKNRSHFLVGNERRVVKFWKDLWCGDQTLEEPFLNLSSFATNKDGWVVEAWEEVVGGGS